MIPESELDNVFAYHPPATPAVAKSHETVRRVLRRATDDLLREIPADAPEVDMVVFNMRQAMFWANAAIACRQVVIAPHAVVTSTSPISGFMTPGAAEANSGESFDPYDDDRE